MRSRTAASYTWAVTLVGSRTLIGFVQLGTVTFRQTRSLVGPPNGEPGQGYGL
jgi:hypothetical protein